MKLINFPFNYSLDIWSSDIKDPRISSSVIGYTIGLGGICDNTNKYSILEFNGFNQIQNAAHELGHRYLNNIILKTMNIKKTILALELFMMEQVQRLIVHAYLII